MILLNDGNPTNQATLTVAQIISALEFGVNAEGEVVNVNLPTKDHNDAFHNALKDYTIVITVSEVVG